jgi:hypothetical protein
MTQRILIGLAAALVAMTGLPVAEATSPARADRIAGITVAGTALQVSMRSGRVLEGDSLVGATLTLRMSAEADPVTVYIQARQMDAFDPQHEITLYHMLSVDSPTGTRQELCGPDSHGEHWAFPLAGQWDTDGRHQTDSGYTLTCADGAQGKCVRFGYKPWKTLPDGTALAPYHQSCIHLVRAAYCGGAPTTNTGTLIDIYDRVGIQNPDPEPEAAGLHFEAAWNTHGAVCVAHTRVPDNLSISQLPQNCPQLQGRVGASCTEDTAGNRGEPVLLFNRSR